MGYQLFMLTLWVGALLSPYHGLKVRGSAVTSGGLSFSHSHTPDTLAQEPGTAPVWSITPSPLRSAGSWKSRIAWGLTGLAPMAVGGVVPRANPSFNHSAVTG